MVPPGTLNYFYTVGYSNELDRGNQKELRHLVDLKQPIIHAVNKQVRIDTNVLEVPKLNYIEGDIEQLSRILTSIEIKKIKALPRPEIGYTPRPKTPWTF